MVKISYNKFHRKYEVYYHKKGKNHIGYFASPKSAEAAAYAVTRALKL